jgi:hypothetical protein
LLDISGVKDFFSLRLLTLYVFLWAAPGILFAQRGVLYGTVTDSLNNPIQIATISIPEFNTGATTDSLGHYEMTLPVQVEFTLVIQHLNYIKQSIRLQLDPGEKRQQDISLSARIRVLDSISIVSALDDEVRDQVSVYTLEPKDIEYLPTPFNEFSKVLVTLPGVVSNNELSSTYSVRGGNYDENLVYVNDIPIYRPFLIRSGEQEGLSFINPDLAKEVHFSSGGWQPEYGDALSSNLNVKYKTPEKFGGSFSIGLLGGTLHLGGSSKSDKISYIVGVRHKRSEYLLNTLETQGQYFPRYTDIQSFIRFKLGDKKVAGLPKTELGLLLAFSKNRFSVVPESRETTFGTFNQPMKIFIAFEGQELLNYNTYQGAVKLTHRFTENFSSNLILSNYYTQEREYFDIEGGYRICDVDNRPGSETFNKCVNIRGIGTDFESARNMLNAYIFNSEIRNELIINERSQLNFGIGYAYQQFDDRLQEYSFVDSADYVTITESIDAENHTRGNVLTGYIQHHINFNQKHIITYGVRLNYLDINQNLLISPRIQYSFVPGWHNDILFRAALGLFQQQPFYREFRRFDGNLNRDVNAQKSYHVIAGMDYNFSFWGRPFKLIVEAYYKYLDDIIPYDINNVRIRYYADNIATGYATGLDMRVSGEFIPGDESWFSIGILSTKENLTIDDRGMIPRPSDQLINFNIFFQDHLPKNPTYRVYLNLYYASGLPFGPPNNIDYRNIFDGESYQRVDIGLSKIFFLRKSKSLESIWLGVEILNLMDRNNKISYYWVQDFSNVYYAVPNSLSGRFFNVRCKLKF